MDRCAAGAGAAGVGGRDAAGAADFAGTAIGAGALVGRLAGLAGSSGASVLTTMPAWQLAARPSASPAPSQCLLADPVGKMFILSSLSDRRPWLVIRRLPRQVVPLHPVAQRL
ncbi:hypothetical protein C6P64_00065 [Malikia granosa]|uniref:Uncharacterized protein n=1 Tax=Malikia granosa TaxID=263067 RepID=A0A2S9K9V6_9BURK|nr:hypothetical protein C6P64_00065 [Malikia granosa]